jgi:hypothetical protein
MTVHDAISKRKRLIGQFHLFMQKNASAGFLLSGTQSHFVFLFFDFSPLQVCITGYPLLNSFLAASHAALIDTVTL